MIVWDFAFFDAITRHDHAADPGRGGRGGLDMIEYAFDSVGAWGRGAGRPEFRRRWWHRPCRLPRFCQPDWFSPPAQFSQSAQFSPPARFCHLARFGLLASGITRDW
jgi:hypothetical protein